MKEFFMGRPNTLDYPTVAKTCHQLIAEGEHPSIRKIYQRTGGSFSTLSAFYQRWQEEQTLASKVDLELSEPFRQAALAEFARVTETLRQTLEGQLKAEK